jgi:hypothetical protein
MTVSLWHFLVHDPAPRSHPLDFARAYHASVAKAVLMLHLSVEDIRDRLDASMRVPWETPDVIPGIIGPEIIQKQEGVKLGDLAVSEGTAEVDSSPFNRGFAFPDLFYAPDSHERQPPFAWSPPEIASTDLCMP